jgi:TPP-dependent pyruvate/acetoin dehydrogenase alpha subunit
MATETVDGQNVRDVFTVASKYVERARKGEGPAFLQFKTYRYHGHHVGDIARAYYRPKAEEQEWVTQRDPITLHGQWLMDNGVADRAALDKVQADLITEMDAAVEFAINSPYPDPSKVDQDIYA